MRRVPASREPVAGPSRVRPSTSPSARPVSRSARPSACPIGRCASWSRLASTSAPGWRHPACEFKLDPTAEWDADLIAAVAATDSVRILDFKAYYAVGTLVREPAQPRRLRSRRWAPFPQAIVEDAAADGETGDLVRAAASTPVVGRADPLLADVEALPLPARHLNIKPSRFGTVRALVECIERARAIGIGLYGGGQFELGVGRGQIQTLASLFYADGPNDVAPLGYNEPEARAGLPASPLGPPARAAGFGFDEA